MPVKMNQRGLLAVAVLVIALTLAACGGGGDEAGTGAGQPGNGAGQPGNGAGASAGSVTIQGFMFEPGDVTVAPGTSVTWTNMDPDTHSIKDDEGLFPTSKELAEGDTFSFAYDQPGTYSYVCGIHPYMKGTVTVS